MLFLFLIRFVCYLTVNHTCIFDHLYAYYFPASPEGGTPRRPSRTRATADRALLGVIPAASPTPAPTPASTPMPPHVPQTPSPAIATSTASATITSSSTHPAPTLVPASATAPVPAPASVPLTASVAGLHTSAVDKLTTRRSITSAETTSHARGSDHPPFQPAAAPTSASNVNAPAPASTVGSVGGGGWGRTEHCGFVVGGNVFAKWGRDGFYYSGRIIRFGTNNSVHVSSMFPLSDLYRYRYLSLSQH